MRLAAAFWSGADFLNLQPAIDRLNTLGLKGTWLAAEKDGWNEKQIESGRALLEREGVYVCALISLHYGLLTSPDKQIREEGIEATRNCIHDAQAIGADCVAVHWRTGGAEDWWSKQCWDLLVEGSKILAEDAEKHEVDLAFHSYKLCPWDTPERHRRLADEVGSPRIKVMLDPFNMLDHRTVNNTTDFINHTFDLLGDLIVGAHAKDAILDPTHWVVKIDEVPPGKGTMDYETYLRRISELDPKTVLTIEHLRDVGVAGTAARPCVVYFNDTEWENLRAKKYIEAVAEKIGLSFDD